MANLHKNLEAIRTHINELKSLIAEIGDREYRPIREIDWKLNSALEDLQKEERHLAEMVEKIAPEILEIEEGYQDCSRIIVTAHAVKRLKERVGISKKNAQKQAEKAYKSGIHHDQVTGSLRKYLDGVYRNEQKANNMRILAEHLYLFRDRVLITVYAMPSHLKRSAESAKAKR